MSLGRKTEKPTFNLAAITGALHLIKEAPASQIRMGHFTREENGKFLEVNCYTAACIGGFVMAWAYRSAAANPHLTKPPHPDDGRFMRELQQYTLCDGTTFNHLFFMKDIDSDWHKREMLALCVPHSTLPPEQLAKMEHVGPLGDFDRYVLFDSLPEGMRKRAAIRVIENLITHNKVDWLEAIRRGIEDQVQRPWLPI